TTLFPDTFDVGKVLYGPLKGVDTDLLKLLEEAEETVRRADVPGDSELAEALRQDTFVQHGHLWHPTSETTLGLTAPHLQAMDPLALIGVVLALGGLMLAGYTAWTTQEERLAHRKWVADWVQMWIARLAR
ncbi:hypothetical protein, partial [Glycomyces algeriensis]